MRRGAKKMTTTSKNISASNIKKTKTSLLLALLNGLLEILKRSVLLAESTSTLLTGKISIMRAVGADSLNSGTPSATSLASNFVNFGAHGAVSAFRAASMGVLA